MQTREANSKSSWNIRYRRVWLHQLPSPIIERVPAELAPPPPPPSSRPCVVRFRVSMFL